MMLLLQFFLLEHGIQKSPCPVLIELYSYFGFQPTYLLKYLP